MDIANKNENRTKKSNHVDPDLPGSALRTDNWIGIRNDVADPDPGGKNLTT